jgi:hypothetical protein
VKIAAKELEKAIAGTRVPVAARCPLDFSHGSNNKERECPLERLSCFFISGILFLFLLHTLPFSLVLREVGG